MQGAPVKIWRQKEVIESRASSQSSICFPLESIKWNAQSCHACVAAHGDWPPRRIPKRPIRRRSNSRNGEVDAAGRSGAATGSATGLSLGLMPLLPETNSTCLPRPPASGPRRRRRVDHATTSRSSTEATPGADHAALSTARRSSQVSTLPSRMILLPFWTVTRIAFASTSA